MTCECEGGWVRWIIIMWRNYLYSHLKSPDTVPLPSPSVRVVFIVPTAIRRAVSLTFVLVIFIDTATPPHHLIVDKTTLITACGSSHSSPTFSTRRRRRRRLCWWWWLVAIAEESSRTQQVVVFRGPFPFQPPPQSPFPTPVSHFITCTYELIRPHSAGRSSVGGGRRCSLFGKHTLLLLSARTQTNTHTHPEATAPLNVGVGWGYFLNNWVGSLSSFFYFILPVLLKFFRK